MFAAGRDYAGALGLGFVLAVIGVAIVAGGEPGGWLIAVPGSVIAQVAVIAWAIDWGTQWLPKRIAWAIIEEQAAAESEAVESAPHG